MTVFVNMGAPEDEDEALPSPTTNPDPDEFFAKHAFRIIYQTNNFFLPQVKDLVEKGDVLNIRPEYQRRLRWTVAQKSKLIESLLLNIPIPPIFLYESAAARYEVIDGQQRLNAIKEFMAGDFTLSSLNVLQPLNGIKYSRCPPRIKRALERSSISAIVLLLESASETSSNRLTMTDLRRFIFDRLNTGGTKLNPQEIRNALNPGPLNSAIIEIARDGLFTRIFGIPPYVETNPNDYYESPERQKNLLYSSMGDCQLVLRYFALRDLSNIRGSMKAMLDRALARKITEDEAEVEKSGYLARLSFLDELFDHKPFMLPADDKGREQVSAAIYDASMVAINDLWDKRDEILADAVNVRARMRAATTNSETSTILTGQGNTAQAVKDRIELVRKIFLP